MVVHCAKCNHQWCQPIELPMQLKQAAQVMRRFAAAGCPSCGAHGKYDVLMGPNQPKPLAEGESK